MVRISKKQMDWLIEHKYLKVEGGKYEYLSRSSRQRRRNRWVTDSLAKLIPEHIL